MKAVNNATLRNGFFSQAGKGLKRITPLGQRVVEALPDNVLVMAIIEENNLRPNSKRRRGTAA
jgi:hypothetical protein